MQITKSQIIRAMNHMQDANSRETYEVSEIASTLEKAMDEGEFDGSLKSAILVLECEQYDIDMELEEV